ncbi:MAG: carotenoid oxygenase family protein [Acidimicrobiia bacterium]|nr:carotenoid oxygenase family protein [Acidimicrobiia bacterium]
MRWSRSAPKPASAGSISTFRSAIAAKRSLSRDGLHFGRDAGSGLLGSDGQSLPRGLPHDMAATSHYSILMDLPLVADLEAARQGRHKIVFDPSLPARFGVIPRHGGGDEIRWFEAEPCYVYHSINAWQDGDEVVLDLCRVNKPAPRRDAVGPLAKMLSYLRLDAHLYRSRFNMRTGAVIEGALDQLQPRL